VVQTYENFFNQRRRGRIERPGSLKAGEGKKTWFPDTCLNVAGYKEPGGIPSLFWDLLLPGRRF
jgi:hypothetical protein